MFSRALATGIALILVLTALLSFALVRITDGDRDDYHALLKKAAPKTDQSLAITQHRKGVVKEIQAGKHHLILSCEASQLLLHSEETCEEMERLKGSLDATYIFEAEKGSYNYRTHTFTAKKGTLQGQALSGEGERVEVYLGKSPQNAPLKGEKLIALKEGAHLLSPKGDLTSDLIWIAYERGEVSQVLANGKTTLHLSDEETLTTLGTLTLDQKNHTITTSDGRVHYTHANGWFAADEMTLAFISDEVHNQVATMDKETECSLQLAQGKSLSEIRVKNLHLKGNVHLGTTKEKLPASLALADEAHYLPGEDLLTLTAAKNNRVLFLDESSDTRLAAREVIAHTKEKSAKGVGGVRCFFHDDELHKLKGMIP